MALERSVSAIYCDDVRQEAGNKVSYMGTYTGMMFVPSFPAVIPKLVVVIHVLTPIDNPFKRLTIKLMKNDESLGETEIPGEALETLRTQSAVQMGDLGEDVSIGLSMIFTMLSLSVAEASKIRIRVQTESEELKGPALVIRDIPTQAQGPI